MATYNFETRELVPYREDWNRGGNVKMCGSLWYDKEKDGIILKADRSKLVGPRKFMDDYCVAKGLPAAILAQGDALVYPGFDFKACYQAYFKQAKELFPTKPAYNIPVVLDDWEYTLNQSLPFDHNTSGFIDNYALMAVGVFLRDLSNPYRTDSLVEKISHNYYYTCMFASNTKMQFVFSQMPTVADRTEAPLIYASGINQPMSEAKLQADGFMAAIINLAIYHFWSKRWAGYNFTSQKLIEKVNRAYMRQEPMIDLSELHSLSFDLPIEVEEICKAYMAAFEPIMRKVWKMNPKVQLECIEGDNIYTYIYAHEAQSPDTLYASELYANLTNEQKRTLVSYSRRFMEWLVKNYPITMASQHRVMQAMAKDMPPIQVTIQNDVKVTHAGEKTETKKSKDQNSTKSKKQELPKPEKETLCPYIDADVLKDKGNYSVEEFQKMLKKACEQEAKVLVAFLIKHEGYGNMDFHGASHKAIYIQLRQCFPTMRSYSYQNFSGAWKAALDSI